MLLYEQEAQRKIPNMFPVWNQLLKSGKIKNPVIKR